MELDVRSGRMGAAMEGKEMVIRREAETPGVPGHCVSLAWPGAPSPRPCEYAASIPITTAPAAAPVPSPDSLLPPCSPNLAHSSLEPRAKDSEEAAWLLRSLPKV